MSYVAAGVAAGGIGVSAVGGIVAGGAASKAARAQQGAAGAWMDQVNRDKKDALSSLNTPAALASYDISLHAQERNVKRMETLAQSIDPALISAGKQAYDLLQGKSAPVLQNIQNQRSLQRTQMLDNLRQQMGPGAETSSAGMQAMQKFDNDTANMMSQTQQQYLDQVNKIALGGVPLSQALGSANESLNKISLNSPGTQAADMISKYTGLMGGAQEATVNAAGGEFKGQQLMGQAIGQIGNAAVTGAAMSMGNRSVGSTPPGTPAAAAGGQTSADYNPNDANWKNYAANAQSSQGTLGAALTPPAAPGMMRSAGAGIPANANYGGAPSANFGSDYQDPRFKPFGNTLGGNVAGGGY